MSFSVSLASLYLHRSGHFIEHTLRGPLVQVQKHCGAEQPGSNVLKS